MARAKSASPSNSSAQLGFEAKLWLFADKLRNNMDAAVTAHSDKRRQQPEPYKQVVLGLIFLKYISDTGGEIRMTNAELGAQSQRSRFAIRTSEFALPGPLAAAPVPRQAPEHRQGCG